MTNTVRVSFHLIVGQYFEERAGRMQPDGKPALRVAKNRPDCKAHEVAVFMEMELPAALFLRPSIRTKIIVPDNAAPLVITPQVQDNIAQVLRDQLGIVMTVEAPAQE